MKIKIIKNISAKILFEDGQYVEGEFNSLEFRFKGFEAPMWVNHGPYVTLSIKNVTPNGDIEVRFRSISSSKELCEVINEKNPTATFNDRGTVYNPVFEDKKQNIHVVVSAEYEEIELGGLKLLIKEEAEADPDGKYFTTGKDEQECIAKVGNTFKTKLLVGKNDEYEIIKIDGTNITFKTQKGVFDISQFVYYLDYIETGRNTRYDYDTWKHSFKIELLTPAGVKFARKKYE